VITVSVKFIAGRYGATPWGVHANEGLVEWPPSPWRIARALIAVGFHKMAWDEDRIPSKALSLIEKMATDTPQYLLPAITESHLRQYVPVKNGNKPHKASKLLDTFLVIDRDDQLLIHYPNLELNEKETKLLGELLELMPYLGRSENWVEAKLYEEKVNTEDGTWCVECNTKTEGKLVRRIAPMQPQKYAMWKKDIIEQIKKDGIKKKNVPESIADCLMMTTEDHRTGKWNRPPGSVWKNYRIPMKHKKRKQTYRKQENNQNDCILLALDADSKNGLPTMENAIRCTEMLHKSFASKMDEMNMECPTLIGIDHEGNTLRGHRHTHFIPLDLDQDGRIDHILMQALDGFRNEDIEVVGKVRRIWSRKTSMSVTCTGAASLEIAKSVLTTKNGKQLAILDSGTIWTSKTPMILPRYKTGRHSPETQIKEELESRGLPKPKEVILWEHKETTEKGFDKYVCARKGKGRRPPIEPIGVTIVFHEPLQGPLCLGYGSHFGNGIFECKGQ